MTQCIVIRGRSVRMSALLLSSSGEYANSLNVQNLWGLCKDSFFALYCGTGQDVRRLYIIWDRYITDSLKQGLRERQGQGVRKRVMSSSTITGNWQTFNVLMRTRLNYLPSWQSKGQPWNYKGKKF